MFAGVFESRAKKDDELFNRGYDSGQKDGYEKGMRRAFKMGFERSEKLSKEDYEKYMKYLVDNNIHLVCYDSFKGGLRLRRALIEVTNEG